MITKLAGSFLELFWCYTGEWKADASIVLIKSPNSIVLLDTGLPKTKDFLVTGLNLS